MKINRHINKWVLNKYSITLLVFTVWLGFFDENNAIAQFKARRELNKLKDEKQYYTDKVGQYNFQLNALDKDPAFVEKYAREHYYMSRENEDVFIVVPDTIAVVN